LRAKALDELRSGLNGSASRVPAAKKQRRAYSETLDRRAVLEEALNLGGSLANQLLIQARGERAVERLPTHKALKAQLASSLIAVEHILAALDENAKDTTLGSFSLPQFRLGNTGSASAQALENLCRAGDFDRRSLETEYARARKARE
jgi:hypothetical protein